MRADIIFVAACLLLTPITASAQVLLAPEPQSANQNIQCGEFKNPATELATLRDHYTAGSWVRLLSDTKAILATCVFIAEKGDPALFTAGTTPGSWRPNYTRDWYLVVLGTVDKDDQPLIIRYLLHEPTPYPYINHTVGVPAEPRDSKEINDETTPRLVQVFLAPNKALTLETKIQVTETANPVVEQIADVAKAVFDPSIVVPLLKGIVPPSSGFSAPAVAEGPLFASVSRVFPPFDRADYKYTDVVRAPAMLDAAKSLLLRDKFDSQLESALKASESAEKAAADAAKAELEIQNNPKATEEEKKRAIARRDATALTAATRIQELDLARALTAAANAYLVRQRDQDCSPESYKDTCWTGLAVAMKTALDMFCLTRAAFCQGERDDLMLVRFNEVGQAPKVTTTSTSTTLAAIPYQRLSFGTVGAYVAGASTSVDRVKVDSGKVVADPIGRAMTAVVLNVHPPFNPKAPHMEDAERWRAFVGAVLTPNLGVSLGAGYGLMRNLSLNVGYGLLVIPTLRDGDQIDAAPSDGKRPFKAGAAHVSFLGLGYKFGK